MLDGKGSHIKPTIHRKHEIKIEDAPFLYKCLPPQWNTQTVLSSHGNQTARESPYQILLKAF